MRRTTANLLYDAIALIDQIQLQPLIKQQMYYRPPVFCSSNTRSINALSGTGLVLLVDELRMIFDWKNTKIDKWNDASPS